MHTVGTFIIEVHENMAIITIPSDEEREESPHGRWQGDSGAKNHRLTRAEASGRSSKSSPSEITRYTVIPILYFTLTVGRFQCLSRNDQTLTTLICSPHCHHQTTHMNQQNRNYQMAWPNLNFPSCPHASNSTFITALVKAVLYMCPGKASQSH